MSTWAGTALGADSGTTTASVAEADLPPLPVPPKLEPPTPERADLEDLDTRLRRLVSDSLDERKEAVREVFEVRPKLVSAVLRRLEQLAERADRERMKRALVQAREKPTRSADATEAGGADGRSDLLVQLVERARPKDEGWRDLVELVAISRMLTQIGNIHAARGLVEVYVRFGEFMRVDVQNRLLDLKDGAVPALIEARRHRAEKVARWAERQLDRMGKVAPSEAIRTDSFEVLADVLRAYGRTKDPDAARIIVTYASSERYQLREAAREAIVLLGHVGLWQLREAYETVVGKRPRRDWSWDRTARELFFEYDRLHAAKTYELLDVGNKAAAEGRLEDMAKAYDALLARSPQFDRAPVVAPGYFRYAEKVAKSDPSAAEAALVRVERLASDPELKKRARSLRDSLRAERQVAEGVVDAYLLKRALEGDPKNQRAKELLTFGDRAKVEALTTRTRWLTSGAIGVAALAAIIMILRRAKPMPAPGTLASAPIDGAANAVASESPRLTKSTPPDGLSTRTRERDDVPSTPPSQPSNDLPAALANSSTPRKGEADALLATPLPTTEHDALSLSPTSQRHRDVAIATPSPGQAANGDVTPRGEPEAHELPKKPRDPFEDIF